MSAIKEEVLNYTLEEIQKDGSSTRLLSIPHIQALYVRELIEECKGMSIDELADGYIESGKNNRRKKDRTLYGDKQYLNAINNNNDLSLRKVEEKFSFTTCQDMEWTNTDYQKFERLKSDYYRFINNRFKKQKEIILKQLSY